MEGIHFKKKEYLFVLEDVSKFVLYRSVAVYNLSGDSKYVHFVLIVI